MRNATTPKMSTSEFRRYFDDINGKKSLFVEAGAVSIDRGCIHDQFAPNIIENGVVDQKL